MAGVIKSGQLADGITSAQVAAFNFEDMARKADTYVETVRGQAAKILTQAKEQAAALERQAMERGREAAVREAERTMHAQLDQRLATVLPALNEATLSLKQARESWLKHWEGNTIQLALAIAERVIRREVTQQPDITLDWLRESLELVNAEGRVQIRLNPRDAELLGERASRLAAGLARLESCAIVADPAIEAGGCRVETEFGSVDQQIHVQLERIREELG